MNQSLSQEDSWTFLFVAFWGMPRAGRMRNSLGVISSEPLGPSLGNPRWSVHPHIWGCLFVRVRYAVLVVSRKNKRQGTWGSATKRHAHLLNITSGLGNPQQGGGISRARKQLRFALVTLSEARSACLEYMIACTYCLTCVYIYIHIERERLKDVPRIPFHHSLMSFGALFA